jgi:hypothetical protein
MVGVAGFEPTASPSRTVRATKLRHTPTNRGNYTKTEVKIYIYGLKGLQS